MSDDKTKAYLYVMAAIQGLIVALCVVHHPPKNTAIDMAKWGVAWQETYPIPPHIMVWK